VTLADGGLLGGFDFGESGREVLGGGFLLEGRIGDWPVGEWRSGAVGVEARVVRHVRQVVGVMGEGCVRSGAGFGARLLGARCQYAGDNQGAGHIA
jgi:hypothetical protein